MGQFWRIFKRRGSGEDNKPATPVFSRFYKQSPPEAASGLLVFVHGVMGGASTTWGQPDAPDFWPAVVQTDPRFSGYDIYVVNYASPPIGHAPNIYETANSELNYLEDRDVFKRYREVHFIAHSMGASSSSARWFACATAASTKNSGA